MSNIKPMTRINKFFEIKDKVVDELFLIYTKLNHHNAYTHIKPGKNSLIYFGGPGNVDDMTFCLEFESKGILTIFYYAPYDGDYAEYSFAFDWTDEDIESGTDEIHVNLDIDEAGLFQQSLVDDIQTLTIETHRALIQYCKEVKDALRIKLENN